MPSSWVRSFGRFGRRFGITIAGGAVLLVGLVFLVTPGPGIPLVLGGLAILAIEYEWARRALSEAKKRGKAVAARARRGRSSGGPSGPEDPDGSGRR